jgi:hypothetical protein
MQLDRFLQNIADTFQGNAGDNREREDDGQFGNPRPASQDPYGDPADDGQFGNPRPASQDPYGDPADREDA